ncbi:MAG TPA: HAMP domain-containing sensor histidine kinase [Ramlibacter sp.]|uniref:HAMP domain-containing sensor histidine kinase n=1 Tax=Ramlibacter sp. TaxID=1917967 RepID=UPI002D800754|nr:HAMP domain-containing sensor histidine kinase [Ramlibacter sp.]HET8743970.1 HAMP domain-containing sensor histidine kinase [Ramlibacter sp.]
MRLGQVTGTRVEQSAEAAVRDGNGAREARHFVLGFDLLRWFSIASLVALMPVAASTGAVISNFVTRQALQRDGLLTAQFISGFLAVEAAQIGAASLVPFLDPRAETWSQGLSPADVDRARAQAFEHLEQLPDVLLVNVYARDRRIVWSTNAALIGETVMDNGELAEAFRLRPDIALHHPSGSTRSEQRFVVEPQEFFIENYVPLTGPDGEVQAVVEVYKEPGHLMASIRAGQRLVWGTTLVGGLFIYLGLFGIVRRASRVLRHQQRQLVQAQSQVFAGDMARALAHSLRNPLGSVRSSAELAGCSDDEMVRKHAQDILTQVDFLSHWIRDLLLYSHPSGGNTEAVDLCSVLESVLAAFQPTFERARIAVHWERGVLCRTPVQGNRALVRQALHSVVSNAIENMPGGGELHIALQLPAAADGIELAVNDSGAGPGVAPRAARDSGFGAGLPMLRRAMERFGGAVAISTAPGGRTQVLLRFSVQGPADEPHGAARLPA